MRSVVASHELLPKGLELESLSVESGHVSIWARSYARRCICPLCGHAYSRMHSRYVRTVSDLPWHGIRPTFEIRARRFFCERLEEVAARARKTSRVEEYLFQKRPVLRKAAAPEAAPGEKDDAEDFAPLSHNPTRRVRFGASVSGNLCSIHSQFIGVCCNGLIMDRAGR